MNIFRLQLCPTLAAQDYQDLHVTKICLEACQLLANCFSPEKLESAPKTQAGTVRKHAHKHHPVSLHTKETKDNYLWALNHGLALCAEFEFRFGKKHFCEEFIKWAADNVPDLVPEGKETEWPQCFKHHPDCVVPNDPVAGYRKYYKKTKMVFVIRGKEVKAKWTKRGLPAYLIA